MSKVLHHGRPVAVSTGRTFNAHLHRTISLCVLEHDLTTPGTPVTVLRGSPGSAQREIRATVAPCR